MIYNPCNLPLNVSFGSKNECGWRILTNESSIEYGFFYLGILENNGKRYNAWAYKDKHGNIIKHRELNNGKPFHLMHQLEQYHKKGFAFV